MGVSETRTVFGDRYEVLETIGQGGMGDVFAAHDPRLDRDVALKVLRSGSLQHAGALTRFLREARAVASLDHPGLVRVFDVADESDPPFIVMELVQGESLEALLRREGTLEPTRAAAIASEIADAIGAAHHAGIVHRDLKPSNVMITPDGTVKVLDFGIASATAWTPLTSRKIIQGTVEYISPEQARGEVLDGRSDLYSLGVVLYEMLLGHPPFTNESPVAILYKHLEATPEEPFSLDPRIPEELSTTVVRCLEKSREDRPASAAELRASLGSQQGLPEPDQMTGFGIRSTRKIRTAHPTTRLPKSRRRAIPLVAAVSVMALGLGIFVPSVFGREEPKRQAKPLPPALEAPSAVSLTSACSGFTTAEATITWMPSVSEGVDGYVIWRSTENGAYERLPWIPGQGTTGAVDEGLATGTNYHFKVQATSGEARSEHSPAVAIGTPVLCMW